MGEEGRRASAAHPLLIAGILAVVILGLFAVPVVECPRCAWNFFGPFEHWNVHQLESLGRCDACGGRKRVSLFKRWSLERDKGRNPGRP